MATRRNYRDEDDYDYPRRAPSNAPAWAMAITMIGAAVAFGLWLYPDIAHTPGLPEQVKGAQGGQAPPAAVRRVSAPDPVQVAPIPGIAQSEAEADKMYQDAI